MTTAPLWMKDDTAIDGRIMRFMAGQDAGLDVLLLPFDIRASAAHVRALASAGLLARADALRLQDALDAIAADLASGDLTMTDQFEDGHSALETWLVARLGDLGKRIHLGRSRNDQVLTATRLYTLEALRDVRARALDAARACLSVARAHEMVVMPGYTHLQRAVPSTVGLWIASFVEEFADDARAIDAAIDMLDACPLGTAAGYGVNLPLQREQAMRELGFGRLHVNPMAAQASRGKGEHFALAGAWQVMQTVRRLAWDLSLFATAEFGFVSLPDQATTGSSIMPNKRNPDLVELLRAASAVVAGALAELQTLSSLPSGYHRDLQSTKAPLVRGLSITADSLRLVPGLVSGLTFHADRMRAACEPAMLATDAAVELAASGLPFRDAYRQIASTLDSLATRDPGDSARARVSPGACADLRLDDLAARLDALTP